MKTKDYQLGMTLLRYLIDENENVSLLLIPKKLEKEVKNPWETPNSEFNARAKYLHTWNMGHIAQLHLRHHSGGGAGGITMKYGQSTTSLKFENQKCENINGVTKIITELMAQEKYGIIHTVTHYEGETAFFFETEFVNKSDKEFTIEMISSFSLDNLSPFQFDDAPNKYALHRFKGGWSMEGKHVCDDIEDLALEKSWIGGFYESEKFGSIGGYPVGRFFPMAVVEDKEYGVFWTAQLEHNATWQMELTRNRDNLSLSGGLGDSDFGHWHKTVKPNEKFKAPRAYISAVCGDIYDACQSAIKLQNYACEKYGEKGLPIAFNEYCATWGDPSEEKIDRYIQALKGKGVKYLVVDAGWSTDNSGGGQLGNGEWIVDKNKFPDMKRYCDKVKSAGMIPGIWFEFEVTTLGSKVFQKEYDNMHLQKNGVVINAAGVRSFWDMRREDVKEYLAKKVIEFLKYYGFGYIKVDYNSNIGIGCDGAESLGEGLRQHEMEAAKFFEKMKREIPDLVIENCASGGHRTEPLMIGLSAITSVTDAHEAVEIPIIAANMHNLILPRQNLIWATLREDDGENRLKYTMAATFLGRVCLSGDVDKLDSKQWNVINNAFEFYKKAENIILSGVTKIYGKKGKNLRYPTGTQIVVRANEKQMLVVAHSFEKADKAFSVEIPDGFKIAHEFYNEFISLQGNKLVINQMDDFNACAVILKR